MHGRVTVLRGLIHVAVFSPFLEHALAGGGIAAATENLVDLFAQSSLQISLFTLNHSDSYPWNELRESYQKRGITLEVIDPLEGEGTRTITLWSLAIFEKLKVSEFTTIIFPDMGGYGLDTIRAKQSGLHFSFTQLIIIGHGSTLWNMSENGCLTDLPRVLEASLMENECIQHCDLFLPVGQFYYDWCLAHGPRPKLMRPLPNVLPPFQLKKPVLKGRPKKEVIFIGRTDPRKGLELLLKSLGTLGPLKENFQFTFFLLGTEQDVKEVDEALHALSIDYKILCSTNRSFIKDYLGRPHQLVVVPSRTETSSMVLLDCIATGTEGLASDIPAFRELLNPISRERNLFTRTPENLSQKLLASLETQFPLHPSAALEESALQWKSIINFKECPGEVCKYSALVVDISLCILSFKREKFLYECLDSIAGQSLAPYEIIIFNNGLDLQEDKILTKLSYFPKSKIKIITPPRSLTSSMARNEMAKEAKGSHLLFLDDDNLFHRSTIETFSHAVKKTNASVIIPNQTVIDEVGNVMGAQSFIGFHPKLSYAFNSLGDTSSLIKKDLFIKLGGFKDWPLFEDWDFLLRAHVSGVRIIHLPERLLLYRRHLSNKTFFYNNRTYHEAFLNANCLDEEILSFARQWFGNIKTEMIMKGQLSRMSGLKDEDLIYQLSKDTASHLAPEGHFDGKKIIINGHELSLDFSGLSAWGQTLIFMEFWSFEKGSLRVINEYGLELALYSLGGGKNKVIMIHQGGEENKTVGFQFSVAGVCLTNFKAYKTEQW